MCLGLSLGSQGPGHQGSQGKDGGPGGGHRPALQADGLLLQGQYEHQIPYYISLLLAAIILTTKGCAERNVDEDDCLAVINSKLVPSQEAHSCVEKAAMIGFVKLRILEPDDHCVLRGARLKEAMMEDIENGLYPFFVSTTLGTTGCCAFDRLDEIGPVCKV